MSTRERRPGCGNPEAAKSSDVADDGHRQRTRPARSTSCTSTCPDCAGTGAIGLTACTRPTQWLHGVGYEQLFGRSAA